ncbi:malate dehydrogenase [Dehalogenimonas alkenigignens]|uniref:Malate dehydrogenase n=1 Tax=Dehalogenimonas alkenigignens TaxID=1217799 RepID=A0A0W0GI40_9CHLR|nr:malate dehydrogenase [Dehalogenimonas alkenigignens]KTB48235.1 malate dehydrogenase (NAD) [Dehalogenimonas alkenigignens]PVV84470.1 malate dehydrogenase [Dehalogenimonas alkenigignens]
MKITVVGAGNVGATLAQRLIEKDFADIALVDVVEGIPQGKALDLRQSANVLGFTHKLIGSNSYEVTAGSDIVVITAGIARKPGMTRDELIGINARIVREVVEKSLAVSSNAVFIIVTNPVDAMTYLALKVSGLPRERIFGLSGVLDGGRLAAFIAEELNVDARDVVPCVMGEHGGSMVVYPRFTTVKGMPLSVLADAAKQQALAERTVNGGAEIVGFLKTGSAFYAPSASVAHMVNAVVNDSGTRMNCAAYLDGEYGLSDVVLGVPVRLGRRGIEEIVELPLNDDELAALKASSEAVRKLIAALNL